jgi:hypothetical protein
MFRPLFATVLLAALAIAKGPDYFPLQVGNQWLYQCSGNCFPGETVTVEVIGTAATTAPDGSPYFILRGFVKDYWVRMVDSNRLVARDPDESAEEKLWYDFSAPENEEYPTWVHPCNVSAKITSRQYPYSSALGDYAALRIEYPATTCNLQGLVEEIFLPGIGLARRVDLVPGSRTYDLIFARINGQSLRALSQIAFRLALDRAVYTIGLPRTSPAITARMTLKNTTPDALHLTFPANPYDLEIRNEQGETVYLWSAGKVFAQVITELDLSPGEQSYLVVIPLETDFDRAWPPGTYTVEARLNTMRPGMYAARVSFQVQWVR